MVQVVAKYEVKKGEEILGKRYSNELREVYEIIESVDANKCFTKKSREKTMKGKTLYSPISLNRLFKKEFRKRGWEPKKVYCKYKSSYYLSGYSPSNTPKGAYREMDFIKNKVGVEVQFGKYAFMVYNVCAKMTIFRKLGHIEVGIEIVPVKELQSKMSTGVSYFEQLVWDLEHRGEADIDIPVLILGVAP